MGEASSKEEWPCGGSTWSGAGGITDSTTAMLATRVRWLRAAAPAVCDCSIWRLLLLSWLGSWGTDLQQRLRQLAA